MTTNKMNESEYIRPLFLIWGCSSRISLWMWNLTDSTQGRNFVFGGYPFYPSYNEPDYHRGECPLLFNFTLLLCIGLSMSHTSTHQIELISRFPPDQLFSVSIFRTTCDSFKYMLAPKLSHCCFRILLYKCLSIL